MNFEITDRKTLKNNSKEPIKIYLILSQFLVIQEAPCISMKLANGGKMYAVKFLWFGKHKNDTIC